MGNDSPRKWVIDLDDCSLLFTSVYIINKSGWTTGPQKESFFLPTARANTNRVCKQKQIR